MHFAVCMQLLWCVSAASVDGGYMLPVSFAWGQRRWHAGWYDNCFGKWLVNIEVQPEAITGGVATLALRA